jgi:type IV pilus assembly protein PilZ
MSEQNEVNRRHEGRTPIELKVEYKRINTFFADYTKNISRGGTFIGTTRPLDVGTEFIFALTIPGMIEPLKLRGRVIWTNPVSNSSPANPPGMGIEFQYTNDQERRDKEAAVQRLLSAEFGDYLASKILGPK